MAKNDDKAGGSGPPRGRPFRSKRLKTSLPRPEAADARPTPKVDGRIAKVMARAGVASRREAEALIEAGRVSVNGEKISSPALNVTPKDRITIDGVAMPQRERTRLFLFHKPRGVVTTSSDTHGRPTIYSVLPEGLPRLISVGRLDINTEGLLLLTNDGGLARALELPETGWLRRYRVRAFGTVTQAQLDGLKNGIEIDGVRYGAIEATFEREQGSNVWLSFAMREGKNREIRNVLRELGLHVNRLIRVSYGPFQLGELVDGAVEEIRTRTLRDQIGERLAALAGADFTVPMLEHDEIEERPRQRRPDARPKREGGRFEAHPGAEGAAPQARPDRDDRVRRPAGDRPGPASGGGDDRRAPRGKSFEKSFEKPFNKRHGDHKPDRTDRGPDRERGAPSSFRKPDRQGQRPDREGGAAPTFQKPDRRRGRFDLERGAKPSFDKAARLGRDRDRSRDASSSQGRPDHAGYRADADRGEGRPFHKPERFGRKPDRERSGASSFGQPGRFESRPDREGGAASPSRKPGGRRRAPDRGKSSGAKPSRVKPAGGKPFGGKPAGGKRFGDRPSGGKPFGGRPSGGRPAGGRPGRGKRDR